MSRYIDADKLNYQYLPIPAIGDQFITKSAIDNMPEEDVAEVKHGKWEELASGYGYKCSVCGAREKRSAVLNKTHTFCYKCGAKMDLEEDINDL